MKYNYILAWRKASSQIGEPAMYFSTWWPLNHSLHKLGQPKCGRLILVLIHGNGVALCKHTPVRVGHLSNYED